MLLPMNHQFYPYQRYVIPIAQRGKGDISIYGGTHPYGQGGNGLGGMFRSLFQTATPLLKTAAKKVGKRLLSTGLDTGVQIAQDVMNGQSLKKAAKTRAKAAGKQFFTEAFRDMTQQQGREKYINPNERPILSVLDKSRKREHPQQRSRLFLTEYGFSTSLLCSRS